MKKQLLITMVVAVMLLLPMSSALAIFNLPTEMLAWDPDKAYNGYTLFTAAEKTYLIDMEGQVVNSWPMVDVAPDHVPYLMENGKMRQMGRPSWAPGGILSAGGVQGRLEEYSWDGTRTWWMDVFDGTDVDLDGVFDTNTANYRMHHDSQIMYNKEIDKWTYLILIWISKDQDDADNMGVATANNKPSRGTDNTWSPCGLIEILPDYASGEGGEIIWFWAFTDHMVTTDPDGTGAAFKAADSGNAEYADWSGRLSRRPLIVADTFDQGDGNSIEGHPELLDVNGMHYTEPSGPRKDFQHCNSFDYDENTGYVAINAKASNEFYVLDHDGTFIPGAEADDWDAVGLEARGSKGDFIYRYGNPGNYYSGEPAGFYDEGDMEMYGTHDIKFINNYHWRVPRAAAGDTWATPPETMALRGAGNFMMFDNGCYNPMNAGSKILEVNPYLRGDDVAPTTDLVWMATSVNGVASINNPTGLERRDQLVWSFEGKGRAARNRINQFYSSYISGATRLPNDNTMICAGSYAHLLEVTDDGDVVWEYYVPPATDGVFQVTNPGENRVFRAHRYSAQHPALVGRDLTPGSTLTGRVPAGLGGGSVYPTPPPAPTGWGTSGLSIGGGGGGSAGGSTGGSAGY
jgi:hypothetical protein